MGCENSVARIRWPRLNKATALCYRLGEVSLIPVYSLVRGEEAVKLGESAAAKALSGRVEVTGVKTS